MFIFAQTDSTVAASHFLNGKNLYEQGRLEEAKLHFEKVVEIFGRSNPNTQYYLVKCNMAEGNYSLVKNVLLKDYFERYVHRDESNPMYMEMVMLISKVDALVEEQESRRRATIVSDISRLITKFNESLESYSSESAHKMLTILFEASHKQLCEELLVIRSLVEEYRKLFNDPGFKPEISLCLVSRIGIMAPLKNESELKSELAGPWSTIHPTSGGLYEEMKNGHEVEDEDSVALLFHEDYSDDNSFSINVINKHGTFDYLYKNDWFEFSDKYLELPRLFEVRVSAGTPPPRGKDDFVWASTFAFAVEQDTGSVLKLDYRIIKSSNASDYELVIKLNQEPIFEWSSGLKEPPVIFVAFSGKNITIYRNSIVNSIVGGPSSFKFQHNSFDNDHLSFRADGKFSQLHAFLLNLVRSDNPQTEALGSEISFQYVIRERNFSTAFLAQNFLIKELRPFFKLRYIDLLPN
jgi:hypothetical protein